VTAENEHFFRPLTEEQAEFLNRFLNEKSGFVKPKDKVRIELLGNQGYYCVLDDRINCETGERLKVGPNSVLDDPGVVQ